MTRAAILEHPLNATLKRILEMQDQAVFAGEGVAVDDAYSYARNKVFSIAQVVDQLMRATPVELMSLSGLNSLNNFLQQALSELTSFISDENPARLETAASYMENALPALWAFTPSAQKVLIDALPALMQSQHKFAIDSVRQVAESSNNLTNQLQELRNESDDLKVKIQDLINSAAKERAEAAATVAKLEQAFSEGELQRQQAVDAAITSQQKAYKTELEQQGYAASKTLQDLDSFRDQAAKIVQVVGNIGVTGNYQRIADDESAAANLWRWLTIGIFTIGIGVAVATFVKFWGEPFSTENAPSILIRLLYAIVITTPAWYSARESARHRSNADRARLTELELASIGPFIELLPEEKKVEIRTELTRLYFGRASEPHTVKPPVDLEAIRGLIADVVKAVKP